MRLPLLAVVLLLSTPLVSQSTLASLSGKNRVLLLFAPDSSSPAFVQQQTILKNHATEISDRDLILIPVLATWTKAETALCNQNAHFASNTEQNQVRSRYKIQPRHFTAILIGKDGGEKLRSHTPVTMEALTTLIDSMPTRQQEVRDRHPK